MGHWKYKLKIQRIVAIVQQYTQISLSCTPETNICYVSIMPQLKREKIEERLHAVEAHTDGETVNKEAKGPTGP